MKEKYYCITNVRVVQINWSTSEAIELIMCSNIIV